MSKSKSAQRNAWLILILIILAVIIAALFLTKDFRQYLRDYEQFQEYKEYIANLREDEEPDDTVTDDITGDNQGNSDTQGTVSENQPMVSENQPEIPNIPNTGEGDENPVPIGDPIAGSREICDVSGNVLWQANMLSEEEASLIRGYVQERSEVYTWANSYEKTMKINELDQKILNTAHASFPNIHINFVGDSITEGVGGAVDANGKTISYANYVQEILQFGTWSNHGVAGMMIANYMNHPELSVEVNEALLFDKNAEITVLFAGLNDYLADFEVKNYGVIDNGTTGGYCGQLQRLVNSFPVSYPDTNFFFVTAYQTPIENTVSTYTNFNGTPVLNDFMEPQRMLAAKYEYPVIDLYSTGFMDMRDSQTAQQFLADSIHPNDAGYRLLGTHIAAEIVLYYLGITG